MPHRRITDFEFQAAKTVRDQALEDMTELCPRAVVSLGFQQGNGEVAVNAYISGDLSPYSREDVVVYLRDLGLQQVLIEELQQPNQPPSIQQY